MFVNISLIKVGKNGCKLFKSCWRVIEGNNGIWEESCKIQTNYNGTKYSPAKYVHINFFEYSLKSHIDSSTNLFEFSGAVSQPWKKNILPM